ncbi:MAG: DNA replication and repair protein RecF [Gemmatimonas sp.]
MLTRLVARDFRNFSELDVAVPPRGLVIVGENGHGKTNLLEAAAYLSLLRSMRATRDIDMIRFGASALHVRAELTPPAAARNVSVGYERATRRKKATLDGVEQPRLTAALGALPSVGFSPADVSLVAGSPGERRRYLDVALALSSRAYLSALQQYRAALLRRNTVLRQAQRDGGTGARAHGFSEQVSVWEPVLAEQGALVTAMRQRFVHGHAERFSQLATAIGERLPVTMRYTVSSAGGTASTIHEADGQPLESVAATYRELFTRALIQQRPQEMRRGMTLVGPHRDEMALLLGGRELRTFGSAGQQRSTAIALRLLELATLRDAIGGTPLLLLDDPFAELDLGRARRVLTLLEDTGVDQVLLAVPRVEDIPAAFTRLERRTMCEGVLS